jgi:hypothetical protein
MSSFANGVELLRTIVVCIPDLFILLFLFLLILRLRFLRPLFSFYVYFSFVLFTLSTFSSSFIFASISEKYSLYYLQPNDDLNYSLYITYPRPPLFAPFDSLSNFHI